ncbi:uncharacterized protein FTJAE_14226 [Fusarium tjaetaba]|uniref:Uncharacterized protein n=1 Tax=Fusarium tjaetaba TaxID=1567544 RepID=A0A8H5QBV9_9HYPO|nr:uncharacterized protein FTJAE_14226 [Fusarium tjaetaba]KAF5611153.1 hypothetical protein FTJAE_14226 [Fusarium tjaetaba]
MKRKASPRDSAEDISEMPLPPWKKIRVPGDEITLPIYEDSKPFEPFPEEIVLLTEEIVKDLDPQSSPPASPMHSEDESEEASHHVECNEDLANTVGLEEAIDHREDEEAVQTNATALCDDGGKV